MGKIRMVDLQGQYLKLKEEINEAIQGVIDSGAFIKGPDVGLFESELAAYMGAKHCVACGNGTDALQVALMSLKLQPGDEVITTPFTFVATVEVVKLLKLKPVLVDIEAGTFNLDPSKLEAAITDKTRAIVPVHLFGQAANMKEIMKIANTYRLHVIEDNAQAIGAEYTLQNGLKIKAGTMGTIGTTSFFPSKNLGAYGDGGALFTNDDTLAELMRSVVNHGMSAERYYYDQVGINSRLDTLQAAVLRVKLRHLDEYHAARQQVAAAYDTAFTAIAELEIPERNPDSDHIFHQYTLKVANGKRDALKSFLNKKDIPAMIYYPVGLHLQKAYRDLGYKQGHFPVTEECCNSVISLPIHTEMQSDQLHYIIEAVKAFFNN